MNNTKMYKLAMIAFFVVAILVVVSCVLTAVVFVNDPIWLWICGVTVLAGAAVAIAHLRMRMVFVALDRRVSRAERESVERFSLLQNSMSSIEDLLSSLDRQGSLDVPEVLLNRLADVEREILANDSFDDERWNAVSSRISDFTSQLDQKLGSLYEEVALLNRRFEDLTMDEASNDCVPDDNPHSRGRTRGAYSVAAQRALIIPGVIRSIFRSFQAPKHSADRGSFRSHKTTD